VAGNGKILSSGDGALATNAAMSFLLGITLDSQNNIYLSSEEGRIRKIDSNGIINTIAGPGNGSGAVRYLGDEGPAVNATLNEPKGIAVDAAGNVYIADTSNARLRMIDRNGIIHLVAAADMSLLGREYWNAVTFDPQGKLYVAITRTGSPGPYSIISRVNPDGSLTRVAGTGQGCLITPDLKFSYDGQPAASVPLCIIVGITFDPQGNLYIPETTYGVLLKMTPDGIVTRVAGNGDPTLPVDGSPALATSFSAPNAAFDAAGNIIVPQTSSGRIREITKTPIALKLSRDHIDLQGAQAQVVDVATNFAEPFAYVVRIKTADGGAWLTANRTTGQTGEPLQVAANPAGLAPGTYRGTVTVILQLPVPEQLDLSVTLTVN
jgi:sugar lactone lactonase YvrE